MFTDPEASIIVGKAKRVAEFGLAYTENQREQYPFNEYADVCYYGNGVGCDGGECWCHCHSDTAPLFISNIEVERWHSHG